MLRAIAAAALALMLVPASPAPLDLEMSPHAYVVASRFGWCFFKMSPDPADPQNRDKGLGFAYKAVDGEANKLLWQTSGWYAFEVFLSDDGDYLVRLGNWPRGDRPKSTDLAIAFYKSGQLLKEYSTTDIVKDPSKVPAMSSHYSFLGDPPPDFSGQPTMLEDKLMFRLRSADGIEYVFDARTGATVSATQN